MKPIVSAFFILLGATVLTAAFYGYNTTVENKQKRLQHIEVIPEMVAIMKRSDQRTFGFKLVKPGAGNGIPTYRTVSTGNGIFRYEICESYSSEVLTSDNCPNWITFDDIQDNYAVPIKRFEVRSMGRRDLHLKITFDIPVDDDLDISLKTALNPLGMALEI